MFQNGWRGRLCADGAKRHDGCAGREGQRDQTMRRIQAARSKMGWSGLRLCAYDASQPNANDRPLVDQNARKRARTNAGLAYSLGRGTAMIRIKTSIRIRSHQMNRFAQSSHFLSKRSRPAAMLCTTAFTRSIVLPNRLESIRRQQFHTHHHAIPALYSRSVHA